MRKLIVFLVLLSIALIADERPHNDGAKWHPAVMGSFYQFSFEGEHRLFESPLSLGANYHFDRDSNFCLGFYLSPLLIAKEGEDPFSNLSLILNARVLKTFGLGLGYTFWAKGPGVEEPKQQNLFFALSFSIADL